MYPNLKAEMARASIMSSDIANILNKPKAWVENRLQGKAQLGVLDAIKIQKVFFPKLEFTYLFATEPIYMSKSTA